MARTNKRQVNILIAVGIITSLLTWFYYAHETFPKPLRAATALFGTPVALASGLSHYLNTGINVYQTPWAVVMVNLIFSALMVYVLLKILSFRRKKRNIP
ncbi:MAG: hypothetical protein JWO32_2319 [Bacteroidetes bacterium]|nr:hypothetical protein [Bacteroidota bacterium]